MKTVTVRQIQERVRNTHPRTRKAHLNTLFGLVVKGGGMVISLVLVPMTIDYLSTDTYGTWLTISSVVTMLTFMDIGIGNGLRNKFSEAVANENVPLARAYVSTAYAVFGGIQVVIVGLFLLLVRYVPWQRVFNTTVDTGQLQLVITLTVVAMAIKLVLDILAYVLLALQEPGRVGLFTFLSSALILVGTYLLTRFTAGNLVYLAALSAISPIIIMLIGGAYLYRGKLRLYRPSLRLASREHAGGLLSLGYKFFFIQIAFVVIFYTDNLIITQLFGPAAVTTYNVAFRYFNAAGTIFAIAIGPYWSAFTEAYVKADYPWMQTTHRYLIKLWVGLLLLVLVMVGLADSVYSLWVGDRVSVPLLLSAIMGLSIVITGWSNVTVAVTNGTGKVKLQLYSSFVAASINLPLAIAFGKYAGMGSAGVILATCLSLMLGATAGGIQAKKLITNRASGIWDR